MPFKRFLLFVAIFTISLNAWKLGSLGNFKFEKMGKSNVWIMHGPAMEPNEQNRGFMNNEITILPKLYDFMLWYSNKFAKYPKRYKYILGERIFSLLLDILEKIIEAKYGKSKANILRKVNLSLEKLRFLIRLSKDTECITIKEYEYASKEIDEIGKMTGGWIKSGKEV